MFHDEEDSELDYSYDENVDDAESTYYADNYYDDGDFSFYDSSDDIHIAEEYRQNYLEEQANKAKQKQENLNNISEKLKLIKRRFLITEITKYGKDKNCIGGFLFNDKIFVGRKRFYFLSTKTNRSIYPSRNLFNVYEIINFFECEDIDGVFSDLECNIEEYYPREQRIEDISVKRDYTFKQKISKKDLLRFFEKINPSEFNLKEYFPKFKIKKSKKVFTNNKLDFLNQESLFYFTFSVDKLFISHSFGVTFLEYNNEMKFKIISDVYDFDHYKNSLKNATKVIACMGISQYYDCEKAPENNGYYLLCNEIYFF